MTEPSIAAEIHPSPQEEERCLPEEAREEWVPDMSRGVKLRTRFKGMGLTHLSQQAAKNGRSEAPLSALGERLMPMVKPLSAM